MRVEFEFSEEKTHALGYSVNQVTTALKRGFSDKNLRCVSDQGIIAFEDNDKEDDFSNMWINITNLFNTGWFLKCATACRFFDDSEEAEKGAYEDVLSQAELLIRK